jgi:hypothetical protein
MASHKTKRAELAAEVKKLQAQQLESFATGTFGGWTPEQEAAHEKRSSRLALLVLELDALDGISE